MRLDRDRFLLLVAAMAAPSGCGGDSRPDAASPRNVVSVAVPPPDADAPPQVAPAAQPAVGSDAPAPTDSAPAASAPAATCAQDNDVGVVSCPRMRALRLTGPA